MVVANIDITGEGFKMLNTEDEVEFDTVETERGVQAQNIKIISTSVTDEMREQRRLKRERVRVRVVSSISAHLCVNKTPFCLFVCFVV